MKVLIITTVNFERNGITSVILNYFRCMDKPDINVDFIMPNEVSERLRLDLEGAGSKIFRLQRESNPILYQRRLMGILKQSKYDIAHVHGNSATMLLETSALRRGGVPVRIVHSHNTVCVHRFMDRMCAPFFRNSYTHAFACCEEAGRGLFKDKPFQIIRNGIDVKKYSFSNKSRGEFREKIKADNRIVIGHIGIFNTQKNHNFLIDSFYQLIQTNPRYLLLLIGNGELKKQMEEKTERLGISGSVIFLGETAEVHNYLQAIDILVMPSHYEGLPVTLVEAQASGLPCVVSDRVPREAGLTDLVQFIPNDTALWVRQIDELAETFTMSDRHSVSESSCGQLEAKGYNIISAANRVRKKYLAYYEESQSANNL